MNMKFYDIELNGHKISKNLPKIWNTADKDAPDSEMFVLEDFSVYAKRLYESLIGIKKYYEAEFNAHNTYKIDEYIDLFNNSFDAFIDLFVSDKDYVFGLTSYDVINGTSLNFDKRFYLLEDVRKNPQNFIFDQNGKIRGFTDSIYEKASKFAKDIFMVEKLCSFTTREFWKKEITKFEDLNLKKDYKILVKCIMPDGWRKEKKTRKLDKYMHARKYHSTSLIDQNNFYQTFFAFTGKYALLLIDYDDKDFICASPSDDYSEEVINGENPLKDKKVFSDVFLQDESNKTHKFFAEAVECETPQNILRNIHLYSEINLRNIQPKAVISPNENSLEFAKKVAKEYGDLPVILKQ